MPTSTEASGGEGRAASGGFRLRGLEMTRIETFTDAAFAFALSLLVISLEPPTSYAELIDALRAIPTFLLSATLLMVFWWGHHQWSRRYGLNDGPTVVLSCLLVFTVLVYVYPLRFLFGLMVEWIGLVGGPSVGPDTIEIASLADVNQLFILYGIGFAAMALALVLLNLHAWRRRAALDLNAFESFETLATAGSWAVVAGVGLLSLLAAIIVPPTWVGVPGWVYLLLPAVMPLYEHWMARRRPAADASRGWVAAGSSR